MVKSIQPRTPLPWVYEELTQGWDGDATYCVSAPGDACFISDAQYYNAAPPNKEDAAYIVTACNAFPDLLAACEMIQRHETGAFEAVIDAIAKAKGE